MPIVPPDRFGPALIPIPSASFHVVNSGPDDGQNGCTGSCGQRGPALYDERQTGVVRWLLDIRCAVSCAYLF